MICLTTGPRIAEMQYKKTYLIAGKRHILVSTTYTQKRSVKLVG